MHAKPSRYVKLSGGVVGVAPYLLISYTTHLEFQTVIRMIVRNAPPNALYILSPFSVFPSQERNLKSLLQAFQMNHLPHKIVDSKDVSDIGPLPQDYLRFNK